ncbi:serine-rich adhesin for platelets-like [Aplysia californica]|uniref:Serine-rich adhesin for platelets-like n=1 Tax=Aplysia californica TaxID=6500 RepID=A0ABM0K152_APLCA|nr:serine-rich adhesin for platelets-like [Aplysia californica]
MPVTSSDKTCSPDVHHRDFKENKSNSDSSLRHQRSSSSSSSKPRTSSSSSTPSSSSSAPSSSSSPPSSSSSAPSSSSSPPSSSSSATSSSSSAPSSTSCAPSTPGSSKPRPSSSSSKSAKMSAGKKSDLLDGQDKLSSRKSREHRRSQSSSSHRPNMSVTSLDKTCSQEVLHRDSNEKKSNSDSSLQEKLQQSSSSSSSKPHPSPSSSKSETISAGKRADSLEAQNKLSTRKSREQNTSSGLPVSLTTRKVPDQATGEQKAKNKPRIVQKPVKEKDVEKQKKAETSLKKIDLKKLFHSLFEDDSEPDEDSEKNKTLTPETSTKNGQTSEPHASSYLKDKKSMSSKSDDCQKKHGDNKSGHIRSSSTGHRKLQHSSVDKDRVSETPSSSSSSKSNSDCSETKKPQPRSRSLSSRPHSSSSSPKPQTSSSKSGTVEIDVRDKVPSSESVTSSSKLKTVGINDQDKLSSKPVTSSSKQTTAEINSQDKISPEKSQKRNPSREGAVELSKHYFKPLVERQTAQTAPSQISEREKVLARLQAIKERTLAAIQKENVPRGNRGKKEQMSPRDGSGKQDEKVVKSAEIVRDVISSDEDESVDNNVPSALDIMLSEREAKLEKEKIARLAKQAWERAQKKDYSKTENKNSRKRKSVHKTDSGSSSKHFKLSPSQTSGNQEKKKERRPSPLSDMETNLVPSKAKKLIVKHCTSAAPPPMGFQALLAMAEQNQKEPTKPTPSISNKNNKKEEKRPMTQKEKERKERLKSKKYQEWLKNGGKAPCQKKISVDEASPPSSSQTRAPPSSSSSRDKFKPTPVSKPTPCMGVKMSLNNHTSSVNAKPSLNKPTSFTTAKASLKSPTSSCVSSDTSLKKSTSSTSSKPSLSKSTSSMSAKSSLSKQHRGEPQRPPSNNHVTNRGKASSVPHMNETLLVCGPGSDSEEEEPSALHSFNNPFDRIVSQVHKHKRSHPRTQSGPTLKKKMRLDNDFDEEEDSGMDDFIDDNEEGNDVNVSKEIQRMFGYDRSR